MTSCGSDDSSSDDTNSDDGDTTSTIVSDCPSTPTDQVAQGIFLGTSFTSPGGIYRKQNSEGIISYFCRINVKEPIDTDSCFFPEFEGTQDSILFTIPSLEEQSISLSDGLSQGFDTVTLGFNRIIDSGAEQELGCGALIIDGLNDLDQLTGSVIAETVDGSTINGNFVLDLCVTGF